MIYWQFISYEFEYMFLEGNLPDIVNYADENECIYIAHWSPLMLTESPWHQQSATEPFRVPLTPTELLTPSEPYLNPMIPTEPNNPHWPTLKPSDSPLPPPSLIDPLLTWLTSHESHWAQVSPHQVSLLTLTTHNDPYLATFNKKLFV